MKNGRIIVNCQNLSIHGAGGAGRYAINLADRLMIDEELEDFKISIDNYANPKPGIRHHIEQKGKEVLRAALPKDFFTKMKKAYLKKNYPSLLSKSSIYEERPENELTLLHEVTNYSVHPLACRWLTNPNLKIVTTFLDLQDFYYPDFFTDEILTHRRLHYSFIKEHSTRFIAISNHTKNSMHEFLGIPLNKIDVIHLASEVGAVLPDPSFDLKVQKMGKFLLYPSKLWKHKNHKFLLSSIARLKEEFRAKGFVLALCGGYTSKEERKLNGMITELGISDLVTIMGFITSNQLRILTSKAQYLIFPSLFEGFGMPVIEAMQLGCPVLSSTAGSLLEVCGEAATFFDPANPDQLDDVLKKVLHSKIEREKMIELGYENVQRFSWDKCLTETLEVYKNVLNTK